MEDRGRFSVFFCRLWKTGDGSLSSFVDCHSRQRTVPCPYVSTSSLPKRLPLMRELSAKLTEGENGFSLLPSRLAPCHLPRQRKAFLGREQGNLSLAPICRLSFKTENRPLSSSRGITEISFAHFLTLFFVRVHANRPLSFLS